MEKSKICIQTKQTRKPFSTAKEPDSRKLEIKHSGLCGYMECET